MRWLEAVVTSTGNSDGVSPPGVLVRLPGGVCVEVADCRQVTLAAALVLALGRPC